MMSSEQPVFLETSALIAILWKEEEAPDLSRRLSKASRVVTGAHVVLESVMAMSARKAVQPHVSLALVEQALEASKVDVVPITHDVARAAVEAFARYGKGRGHPAQLNFGDCLSYACARGHGAALLFKGEDFAATDAPPA